MKRRVMAIVGLVYVAILLALSTYAMVTDRFLYDLVPLLVCPAAAALGIYQIVRIKRNEYPNRRVQDAVVMVICFFVLVIGLVVGLGSLLSQL